MTGQFPILSRPVLNADVFGNDNGTFYAGFALGAAAAAQVRVREKSVTGKIIDTIWLLAGTSQSVVFQDPWVYVDGKIYVEVVTGAPEGCIRWK
jgi:hypothetical protein